MVNKSNARRVRGIKWRRGKGMRDRSNARKERRIE